MIVYLHARRQQSDHGIALYAGLYKRKASENKLKRTKWASSHFYAFHLIYCVEVLSWVCNFAYTDRYRRLVCMV